MKSWKRVAFPRLSRWRSGRTSGAELLLKVNQLLLKISRGLFAYQVCLRARALPDSRHLLKETISGSAKLRAELLDRVA